MSGSQRRGSGTGRPLRRHECGIIQSYAPKEQMQVASSSPRFTAESLPGGVRVVIPSRKHWFAIMFFGLFSALLAIDLFIPSEKSPSLFDGVVELAVLAIISVCTLWTVLWELGGKEVITIQATTFEHRRAAFGIGFSRRYALSEVRNLRFKEYSFTEWTGHGSLAFDYVDKTVRIGRDLPEVEARMLLENLKARIPLKLGEA